MSNKVCIDCECPECDHKFEKQHVCEHCDEREYFNYQSIKERWVDLKYFDTMLSKSSAYFNIRDSAYEIFEEFEKGEIYFPANWKEAHGNCLKVLGNSQKDQKLVLAANNGWWVIYGWEGRGKIICTKNFKSFSIDVSADEIEAVNNLLSVLDG